jgi:hypothetical protein
MTGDYRADKMRDPFCFICCHLRRVSFAQKQNLRRVLPVLFSLPYLFADFYTEQEHVDGLIVFLI